MKGRIEKRDEAVAAELRDGRIWVTLRDNRIVSMPISFFPWLDQATPEQQANFKIYPSVLLWPELEDGIDMYAFITGDWLEPASTAQAG